MLFFFYNHEFFRLPQSYTSGQQLVPTANAIAGNYTYQDSTTKQLRTVNIYNIAGSWPYATTPDPVFLKTVQDELAAASGGAGRLTRRFANAKDYNRSDFNFAFDRFNKRQFPTLRS